MIRFACPKCKQVLQVDDSKAGGEAACPTCQTRMRVPSAPPAPAPPPAAPAGSPFADLDDATAPLVPEPGAEYPGSEGEETEWRPQMEGGEEETPEESVRRRPGVWPPEVQALGSILQVHEGRRWPQVTAFLAGITMCVLSCCCVTSLVSGLVYGPAPTGRTPVAPAPQTPAQPPPSAAMRVAGFVILLVPILLFIAAGVGLVVLGRRLRPRTVLVCRDGLAAVSGRSADVCRWNEVHGVYQRIMRTRVVDRWGQLMRIKIDYLYTLERESGRKLLFKNSTSAKILQLGNTIQREVTRRLLPLAFKAVVEERRVLSFGPFGVGFDGLRHADETLLWDDVGFLSLRGGVVRVRTRHDLAQVWAAAPVPQIANLHVFLNIVENLSGKRWR